MQRIFEKNYIIDENDSLSEYNKILLDHNRTNGAVYSKINFKVEICSALSLFDSHPALLFLALILRNPNNHYNQGFPITFDYNHYVYIDYLVCSVAAIAHIIRY